MILPSERVPGDRVRTAYIPCTELCCVMVLNKLLMLTEMSQVKMTQEPSGVTGAVVNLIYDFLTSLHRQNDLIVNTWDNVYDFEFICLII